jgi:hypothetical protein
LETNQAVEPKLFEFTRAVRKGGCLMASSDAESVRPPSAPPRVALRVRLHNDYQPGPVDGAWWPQSRDLLVESVDLVEYFPHHLGRIKKLLFSRPDWDVVGRRPGAHHIRTQRGSVEVGSFPSDDTHLMIVTMRSGQRHRLLVIPTETPPDVAARIMEEAADEGNSSGPAELLELIGPDQSHIGFDIWNH